MVTTHSSVRLNVKCPDQRLTKQMQANRGPLGEPSCTNVFLT